MEIPKILNLYPLDKLRDRKSEGVVQKYTSSFYLHVLEKALCLVFVKDTFSCRPKAHLEFLHMFCSFSFNVRQSRFLQTSCMSKRSSYFPRTCPHMRTRNLSHATQLLGRPAPLPACPVRCRPRRPLSPSGSQTPNFSLLALPLPRLL